MYTHRRCTLQHRNICIRTHRTNALLFVYTAAYILPKCNRAIQRLCCAVAAEIRQTQHGTVAVFFFSFFPFNSSPVGAVAHANAIFNFSLLQRPNFLRAFVFSSCSRCIPVYRSKVSIKSMHTRRYAIKSSAFPTIGYLASASMHASMYTVTLRLPTMFHRLPIQTLIKVYMQLNSVSE